MTRTAVWTSAALAAFAASIAVVGSDVLWMVPLGHEVAAGHLPGSVPFASAPTSGWHDVPALAELVFFGAYRMFGGERGLLLVQVAAVACGFAALARGLARETTGGAAIVVPAIALVGMLPAVAVVSATAFSLALFPLLLVLLEAESRVPSRRIWLAVPLLALWGNLHGAVLAGWAVLACYLVFDRFRRERSTAISVLTAATAALFANPALWRTPLYYLGVFGSQPARHGTQLWRPLGLHPLDLVLAVAVLVLAGIAIKGRAALYRWEAVALLGATVATIHVARNGAWLLFLLAFSAARALRIRAPRARLLRVAAAVVAAGAMAGVARGPFDAGSHGLAQLAAHSKLPVLATPLLGQQVAAAGGRVWVDNPIDAFTAADQRLYLDWLAAKPAGAGAIPHAGLVLVADGSASGRLAADDQRLKLVAHAAGAALYLVRAI